MVAGEQVLVGPVVLQHLLGDSDLVHFGRAVGDAHHQGRRHHAHERHLVGDAHGAVQVRGGGGDVVIDLRHRHLDRGDVLAHQVVVLVLVDQPGGAQHQQAERLQRDPAVADLLLHHRQVGQPAVAGLARDRPAAHQVEGLLAGADGAHRVVHPAAGKAGLRDQERAAAWAEQGFGADLDVGVAHVAVAAAFAGADADAAHDFHARGLGRDDEDRGLLVDVLMVGIGDRIDDQDRRAVGAGREVLLAVDHPLAVLPLRPGLEGGGVRAAGRLAHRERRADVAVQQRPQPLFLLLRRAVVGDDLGVAGVGRLAAEDRRRHAVAAQLLVHQAQLQLAVALAAKFGAEVAGPQALRLHFFLQRLDELLASARHHQRAAKVREGLDLLLHELFDPIELLLKFRIGLEIPGHAVSPNVPPGGRIVRSAF